MIRELVIFIVAALLPTVGAGCVRASYVRDRSSDISQLSKEVRSDIEHCSDVYDEVKEATLPVAPVEPCQQPGCGEPIPSVAATNCEGSLSATKMPEQQAVNAANQAKECAKASREAAKQARVAASTTERQAYERGRRSMLQCTGNCDESRRRCDHALSQIDRVIDAADALGRKAH